MSDTSQSLTRVAALVGAVVIFAAVWREDQPEYYLALRTAPGETVIARKEFPARKHHVARAAAAPMRMSPAAGGIVLTVNGVSKSLSVESAGLTLNADHLALHLSQLPLGIATGDYRIVDPAGGVGWLRVRSDLSEENSTGQPLLTTTVDRDIVRFIRVNIAASDSATRR